MQVLLKPLMQYLIYPLAIKLAGWVYKTYMISNADSTKKEVDKQRAALSKAIEGAKSDEDIISLSIILNKLDKL